MTPTSAAIYRFFIILEAHLDAEIDAARNREVAIVDSCGSGTANRGGVAVHDGVEPGVIGKKEYVGRRDEEVRVSGEVLGDCDIQRDVSQAEPVDVLLDEQLFADRRVVARLNCRNHDDVVLGGSGAVLLAVPQHTVDYPWRFSVQRTAAEP